MTIGDKKQTLLKLKGIPKYRDAFEKDKTATCQ